MHKTFTFKKREFTLEILISLRFLFLFLQFIYISLDRFIALETNFEKKRVTEQKHREKKVVTYLCRFNNNNNNEMIEKVSSTILTKRNETKLYNN